MDRGKIESVNFPEINDANSDSYLSGAGGKLNRQPDSKFEIRIMPIKLHVKVNQTSVIGLQIRKESIFQPVKSKRYRVEIPKGNSKDNYLLGEVEF